MFLPYIFTLLFFLSSWCSRIPFSSEISLYSLLGYVCWPQILFSCVWEWLYFLFILERYSQWILNSGLPVFSLSTWQMLTFLSGLYSFWWEICDHLHCFPLRLFSLLLLSRFFLELLFLSVWLGCVWAWISLSIYYKHISISVPECNFNSCFIIFVNTNVLIILRWILIYCLFSWIWTTFR